MKFLKIFLCSVLIMVVFSVSVFALNSSTYSDLSPSASQVTNLISSAMNYESFLFSDFVVFQDAQYSYRIVWSDKLEYSSGTVSSDSPVEIITYTRTGSGYDYTYEYTYSTDSAFRLTVNKLTVSNVEGLGARSEVFANFESINQRRLYQIFSLALIIVISFVTLRKGSNRT